jgi:hypothetical protein
MRDLAGNRYCKTVSSGEVLAAHDAGRREFHHVNIQNGPPGGQC